MTVGELVGDEAPNCCWDVLDIILQSVDFDLWLKEMGEGGECRIEQVGRRVLFGCSVSLQDFGAK